MAPLLHATRPARAWLGREDSNLRIRDPKSRALPLGHAPGCPCRSTGRTSGPAPGRARGPDRQDRPGDGASYPEPPRTRRLSRSRISERRSMRRGDPDHGRAAARHQRRSAPPASRKRSLDLPRVRARARAAARSSPFVTPRPRRRRPPRRSAAARASHPRAIPVVGGLEPRVHVARGQREPRDSPAPRTGSPPPMTRRNSSPRPRARTRALAEEEGTSMPIATARVDSRRRPSRQPERRPNACEHGCRIRRASPEPRRHGNALSIAHAEPAGARARLTHELSGPPCEVVRSPRDIGVGTLERDVRRRLPRASRSPPVRWPT